MDVAWPTFREFCPALAPEMGSVWNGTDLSRFSCLGSVRTVSHLSPLLREGMAPVAGRQDAVPPWLALQEDLIAQQHQIDVALQGLVEERRVL